MLGNFLSPPILFFLLGLVETLVRSVLALPSPLPKILSLYLLLAIGFKGGAELALSGLSAHVALTLGAAILAALVVPVYSFYLLRLKLDVPNAAPSAATSGSVTTVAFLDPARTRPPATWLPRWPSWNRPPSSSACSSPGSGRAPPAGRPPTGPTLRRDAFLNGAVFLLLGSLLVGALTFPFNILLGLPLYPFAVAAVIGP